MKKPMTAFVGCAIIPLLSNETKIPGADGINMKLPQRLLPRFAIRTLFIATAVCAIVTAFLTDRYKQRQLAEFINNVNDMADVILVQNHWERFQTTPGVLQPKLKGNRIQEQPVFLFPNRSVTNGELPDSYESNLLSDIRNNGDSRRDVDIRQMADGSVVSYKAIRAQASCLTCHDSTQTRPGDVLAVLKMTKAEW
jgi:hypothetical protein